MNNNINVNPILWKINQYAQIKTYDPNQIPSTINSSYYCIL